MTAHTALLGALRRPRDEVQLTQVLAAVFRAEPRVASAFLRLVLPGDRASIPDTVECRHEESFEEGRIDLRFTASELDVIVELKIHAGYGRDQLARYLRALRPVELARLVAVTRDVPTYGESQLDDPRWAGSLRWRVLRSELRQLPFEDGSLRTQWLAFLDLLESEGSMGFTHPDQELFDAVASVRRAARHAEEFLDAIHMPLLQSLNKALGGGEPAADFWRAKGGTGKPVISKRWSGIIDLTLVVPPHVSGGIRAGVFAYNPPTRFFVAPVYGRRLSAKRGQLTAAGRASLQRLLEGEFREYDVHAFLPLDGALLGSPTFEDDVVDWAYARFAELVESGLLSEQHQLGAAKPGSGSPADDEQEPGDPL